MSRTTKSCFTHRIRLEKLKRQNLLLSIIARLLVLLAFLFRHYG